MQNLINEIGQTIKEAREKKGLIQKDLAAQAGVSRVLVYRLEQGLYPNPSLGVLEKIAAALGLEMQVGFKPVKK
jgi:transcriptional regulator with XRE-family HTH domain